MLVNSLQMKQIIIDRLQTLPVCKPSSNKQNWVVRCPYCGDSSHGGHGHFSIRIDVNSDAPMIFRCFRCNESGLLTAKTLDDLDIGLPQDLQRSLELINRMPGNSEYFRDKIKPYRVPVPEDTGENARKLHYINKRIGSKLTYEECAEYRIILSIAEFMRANHLKISKNDDGNSINIPLKSLQELETNYLGFLSSNNNKITFRDITPDQHGFFGRYYKVTIDIFNQSPNTFYGLKNQFNLLYTGPIDVHISEGTFDILSVYRNLKHDESQNALFFASCGYGFGTILKYLVYMGVDTDVVLHIYSDNDKGDFEHRRSLKKYGIPIWLDQVIVHRNGYPGEKDFGVPKSRIKEYSYELKLN